MRLIPFLLNTAVLEGTLLEGTLLEGTLLEGTQRKKQRQTTLNTLRLSRKQSLSVFNVIDNNAPYSPRVIPRDVM